MSQGWVLNYDSAPFCNGSLHLGHVRNYVLGDIRARWIRSRGVRCSYRTSFDAFGLPNEQAAGAAGVPIDAFVAGSAKAIQSQMDLLRLSYSQPSYLTSDPGYYRWTQWLFLRMWDAGLVYSQQRNSQFCVPCGATLSSGQAVDGLCWRCSGDVTTRNVVAWYIRSGCLQNALLKSRHQLVGWSERGRNLLESATRSGTGRADALHANDAGTSASHDANDWLVSRSASWGTPMPIVACITCGPTPVPDSSLPVRLRQHGGSGQEQCRGCGTLQPVLPDTLDCFFDDSWCFFAAARDWKPGVSNPFELWRDNPPDEVHFHAGYDTVVYLPLYRFVGRFLFDSGYAIHPEPIDVYHGHDVVTAKGRKMSKSLGNAPNLNALLAEHGPEVIRLSAIINVNPDKPMPWSADRIRHAIRFVDANRRLRNAVDRERSMAGPCSTEQQPPFAKETFAKTRASNASADIDKFLSEYRIAAALDKLFEATKKVLSRYRASSHRDYEPDSVLFAEAQELLSWWNIFTAADEPAPDRGPVKTENDRAEAPTSG